MTNGPDEEDDGLQYSQIMDRTTVRRIITCYKCGESDQKSSQMSCRSCKKLLEMHFDSQLRTLRSLTAELTHKYGLIWKPTDRFSHEGASVESARANRHWVHAVSKGYESIRDRYYRDSHYREFLEMESITVEHMEFWDEIGNPMNGGGL